MRISFGILAAAAATATGLLVFAAPAMASAAAPQCESGGSVVVCDALGGAGPYTWTVTERIEGTTGTSTYSTPSGYTKFGCARGQTFWVSYSYVANGVTQTSPSTYVSCNTGPWQ